MWRFLFASGQSALTWAALGVVFTITGFTDGDPWGYIGGGAIILAAIVAVVAVFRSPRVPTITAALVASIPLGLMIWFFYKLSHDVS